MCLQCTAEARILLEHAIPGYALMVATKDTEEWHTGQYGLVHINDPDFIWTGDPLIDPTEEVSDEEWDALSNDDPRRFAFDRLVDLVESMKPCFKTDPMTGFSFIQACMQDGYTPALHGRVVLYWFIDHIARKLEANKNNSAHQYPFAHHPHGG
jgi:hypothetical protein